MAPWYDCREVNSVFKQVCEKSTSKVTYTSECQKKKYQSQVWNIELG